MVKNPKRGLPKALEREDEESPHQSPEEFAKEFFGSDDKPQDGLPTLQWLKENYKTKSAAIRYLTSLGHKPNIIARHLGIRYQHARNVAISTLKRGPNEDWRPPAERKPHHGD